MLAADTVAIDAAVVEFVGVDSDAQRVTDGQRQTALDVERIMLVELGGGTPRHLIVRICRDVGDRACEGASTVQRTLRTLYDLDALDVDEPWVNQQRTTRDTDGLTGHVDTIDERRHVRPTASRRQAADDDASVVRGDAAIETQARIAIDDAFDVLDALTLQRIG